MASSRKGKPKGRGLIAAGATLLLLVALGFAVSLLMASRAANPSPCPEGDGAAAEDGADLVIDWDYWQRTNPDVVAWVEIPGTAISQPVVQAPVDDKTYYLTHDVYREWNFYGCPYIDADCPLGIDSWSTVISGHNISTPPAMFHDLELFHDPDFLAEHSEAVIYTPAETRRLDIVGSRTIEGRSAEKVTDFATAGDFQAWQAELLERLGHDSAETAFSQIVTFCSCSYFFNPGNERTLVYAAPCSIL